MDSFDRAILSLIQADGSLPLNEIAARVGLSPTPCWNRIRKMEESGIIAKRVAVLDAARLGLGVTIYVSIETADHWGYCPDHSLPPRAVTWKSDKSAITSANCGSRITK